MSVYFEIKSQDISILAINGKALPSKLKSFAVEGASEFCLTLFGDQILATKISFMGKPISSNENIVLTEVADSKYLIWTKNHNFAEENFVQAQGEVKVGGATHQITLLGGKENKAVLETHDRFQIVDFGNEKIKHFDGIGSIITLKGKEKVAVVEFGTDYDVKFCGDTSKYEIRDNVLSLREKTLTTEGWERNIEFSIGAKPQTTFGEYVRSRKGNYTSKTRDIAFLECLKYGSENEILQFMTSDFSLEDIAKLKSYIGDFDELEKNGEIVALMKKNGESALVKVEYSDNLISNINKL